jgi:hypothetical protein
MVMNNIIETIIECDGKKYILIEEIVMDGMYRKIIGLEECLKEVKDMEEDRISMQIKIDLFKEDEFKKMLDLFSLNSNVWFATKNGVITVKDGIYYHTFDLTIYKR